MSNAYGQCSMQTFIKMFPMKHWGIFLNAEAHSEPFQISRIKVLYPYKAQGTSLGGKFMKLDLLFPIGVFIIHVNFQDQIWSQSQYIFCPVYWTLCVYGKENKLLFFYYIFLFQIKINKLLSNCF